MCLLAPAAAAAAMETEGELQEADVLWPSHEHHHSPDDERLQRPRCWPAPGSSSRKRLPCPFVGVGVGAAARGGRRPSAPAPIVIPVAVAAARSSWDEPASSWWEKDDEEEAAFVPPHVVLAARRRRWESEGRAASSVCVGLGRTLKGRDLQSVRTAVLRMTGFIET